MKKIAILGATDFQKQLVDKANSLGFETHVFSWEGVDTIARESADYFYPISIDLKDQVLAICKEVGVDGITSVASDFAVPTMNYIAEALGLPGNPMYSTEKCTNKTKMRQALAQIGLRMPWFQDVAGEDEAQEFIKEGLQYPLILKPTDRSGSRNIVLVNSDKELLDALPEVIAASFEKRALLEEYLPGQEYSCECITVDGEHHLLAITEKTTTGAPNFIETGHREPARLAAAEIEEVRQTVFKALTGLGIVSGASHTEFKILPDRSVGIIEVAARMGGGCIGSDLVYLSTGIDYLKLVLDTAVGNSPDFGVKRHPLQAFVKFILTEKDLQIMENTLRDPHNILYRKSEIEMRKIGSVTDCASRAGYYIYTRDTAPELTELVR